MGLFSRTNDQAATPAPLWTEAEATLLNEAEQAQLDELGGEGLTEGFEGTFDTAAGQGRFSARDAAGVVIAVFRGR